MCNLVFCQIVKYKSMNFFCDFPLKLYLLSPGCYMWLSSSTGNMKLILSSQSQHTPQNLSDRSYGLQNEPLLFGGILTRFCRHNMMFGLHHCKLIHTVDLLWQTSCKCKWDLEVNIAAKAFVWSWCVIPHPIHSRCPRAFDFRYDCCVMHKSFSHSRTWWHNPTLCQ